jgi:hypothetical protein
MVSRIDRTLVVGVDDDQTRQTVVQQPDEILDWTFDFSKMLPDGVISLGTTVTLIGGLLLGGSSVIAGSTVKVFISTVGLPAGTEGRVDVRARGSLAASPFAAGELAIKVEDL